MNYERTTGKLTKDSGELIGIGYSGHGEGKNNPSMEQIHNVGPLPKGKYMVGEPYTNPHSGPFTMNLTPDPSNEMYGRSGFMLHGDSIPNPGTASTGCIIMNRAVRESVHAGSDKVINVN